MLDNFLAELFSPQAPGGPASFGQRFSPGVTPMAEAPSNPMMPPMQGDGPAIDPTEIVRKLVGMNGGGPPAAVDMSARAAQPSPPVPLPTPKPNIPAMLAGPNVGGGGAAIPAAASPSGPAPGGSDIMSRLSGMFNRGGAPSQVGAPAQAPTMAEASQPPSSPLAKMFGIDPRTEQRIRASLAGGFAGGNPAFAGGALMKGAGGALAGGLKSDQNQTKTDQEAAKQAQKQANFERTQGDTEQQHAALRKLYGARTTAALTGRPNSAWNKPVPERWKDAQKLIMDKAKQLQGGITAITPKEQAAQRAEAERQLEKFKTDTYQKYGFDKGGNNAMPAARPGGAVPSTDRVVGDKEATATGLYDSSSRGQAISKAREVIARGANPQQVKKLLLDKYGITVTDDELQ